MGNPRKKFIGARRAMSKSRKTSVAADRAAREPAKQNAERTANEFRQLLSSDGIDMIVRGDLRSVRENLRDDLERRCAGAGIAIFDTDFSEDVRLITAHLAAFDVVLRYYGDSAP